MAKGNPLIMPKFGLTMTEGRLSQWCVAPGDRVSAGQILFVVETDKIANDVEAPADGEMIDIVVLEGDTVPVGTIVGHWTGPAQATATPETPATSVAPATPDAAALQRPEPLPRAQYKPAAPSHAADTSHTRRVASPFARRLASNNDIDLSRLNGTGEHGRIKARDVLSAVAERGSASAPSPLEDKPIPTSSVRRAIAARLIRSKTQIPHFYVAAQADIRALDTYRAQLNSSGGFAKLTITPFLVAAIGRALAARPTLNRLWRDSGLLSPPDIAVGVAVDTDAGVRMPVIAGADARSLDEIAVAVGDAALRARAGQLRHDDMRLAAASVSNVGMMGVTSLAPIIDPDQSYVLGVGAPQSLFRPDAAGTPVAVREITLTLACDHRLIDGAAGAEFLRAIVDVLEDPGQLPHAATVA